MIEGMTYSGLSITTRILNAERERGKSVVRMALIKAQKKDFI